MASIPPVSELKKFIRRILKDADLTKVSSKMVRKQCEEEFNTELLAQKKVINKIILACIDENERKKKQASSSESSSSSSSSSESSESSESEEEPAPKKQVAPKKSPQAVKKNTAASIQKKVVVPKKTQANNKNTSSMPIKKRAIATKPKEEEPSTNMESSHSECDDAEIARKLQEEEWNFRRRAVKKVPKRRNVTKGEPKARRSNGYNSRKCLLSADLAAFLNETEMTRTEIIKRMWAIAKERDLFDPNNKQFIICDEPLEKLFRKKRVRMFAMMKYLKNHIYQAEQ